MQNLKDKLIKYKEEFPSLKKIHDKGIINELISLFPNVNPKMSAAMVLLNLHSEPTCLECNSPVEFKAGKSTPPKIEISKERWCIYGAWKMFCSSTCSRKSQLLVEKRRETNKKRYGHESWAQSDKAREQMSVPWDDETKRIFKEKSTKTYQEKYGVDHFSQTEEYLEKRTKTCQEKYGVDNTYQLFDRIMETHIEKYGAYYTSTPEGRDRLSKNNAMKKPEIALKSRLNRVSNYYSHNPEFMKILNSGDRELFKNYIDSLGFDNRFDIADNIGISYTFLNYLFRLYDMRYAYLSKGKRNSKGQREILEFIKEIYNGNVIINDRTVIQPKELDFYIPEFNLAIEYNGVYYHSEGSGGKDSFYHVDKTNGCESKGVQLLHIFETEWNNKVKNEIWKSIIRNKFGLIQEKIYARKCILKEISSSESRLFLDNNHLSGFQGAEKHLGLFYNNELVSVLSYGKSRFKKDEKEIIRFASKINTVVIGAFGKFFKVLPDNIITYADRRISSILNCGYDKFFSKVEILHPNWYGYDRDFELKHRLAFQKHILKETLENYDESLSVFDNMLKHGYDRIWDSGNLKFSIKK